ncbi:hypothetical protein CRUP_027847, partial [Coryphaenoides rupestris]
PPLLHPCLHPLLCSHSPTFAPCLLPGTTHQACRMSIINIVAREILDSRGNPTVEVDLKTAKGLFRAAVPSGASTGIYEALELRDGDKNRYKGKGVLKAVGHINDSIAPKLIESGISVLEQEKLDDLMIEMDGTENKSKFGANAILGVSLAICKAGASEKGVPLYRHIADLAGNTELVLPVPEFMVLPVGAESFRDALRVGAELYQTLRGVIKEKYGQDATNVGDEGGFAPNILENCEALELLKTAIEKAGFTDKVVIGMDVAASEFFIEGKYDLDFKSPPNAARHISGQELADIYQGFVNNYPGLFRAAVPSGASTGIYEALELRDGDKNRYKGKGVLKAVGHINDSIAPKLIESGISVLEQEKLDDLMIEMDGTENKSKFGANAILGVSLAICKAGASEKGVPLYRHIADLAGNTELVLPVPEFMVLPVGAESFRDALRVGAELYQTLRGVIKEKYGQDATNVGDEGGFAPNILENCEALELLKTAIEKAGFTDKVVIGMDVAASEFFIEGKYDLDFKSPPNAARHISGQELADIYQGFVNNYPVVSIEDPFDQDDWPAWSQFTASVGIQVVGDDLTVTNPCRIERALEEKACNCLLLKVNQIGSVTESIKAIEEELGDQARFAGHNFRNPSAI